MACLQSPCTHVHCFHATEAVCVQLWQAASLHVAACHLDVTCPQPSLIMSVFTESYLTVGAPMLCPQTIVLHVPTTLLSPAFEPYGPLSGMYYTVPSTIADAGPLKGAPVHCADSNLQPRHTRSCWSQNVCNRQHGRRQHGLWQ